MDIFNLIEQGNLEEIKKWVKDENINKNVIVARGDTPLHYAIELGNEEAAEIFIKSNLYTQSVSHVNNTPLHYAAIYNVTNVASLLIKRGAIVNVENKFGDFPLHCAAENDFGDTVLVLIENGAEINVFNEEGETPLVYAIWYFQSFETTKTLLDEGASLLTHDKNGNYYLTLSKNENIILLSKHHLKIQKYVASREKLFLTSRVFLKFLNTFKFSFLK